MSSIVKKLEIDGSGTTFKELSTESLRNEPLLTPPLSEQQSIANFLDAECARIDAVITKKEEQISTLEEYRKALIYNAVTGKMEVPAA